MLFYKEANSSHFTSQDVKEFLIVVLGNDLIRIPTLLYTHNIILYNRKRRLRRWNM